MLIKIAARQKDVADIGVAEDIKAGEKKSYRLDATEYLKEFKDFKIQ